MSIARGEGLTSLDRALERESSRVSILWNVFIFYLALQISGVTLKQLTS